MHPIEEEIIKLLTEIKNKNSKKSFFYQFNEIHDYIKLEKLFATLKASSAIESQDFLAHSLLVEYITHASRQKWESYSDGDVRLSSSNYLIFWHLIRTYQMQVVAHEPRAEESIIAIEKKLKTEELKYNEGLENGKGIHDADMFYPSLIRDVYRSGDLRLIALFEKYLHVHPREDFFDEHTIPDNVREKALEASQALHSFFSRNRHDIQSAEKQIIQIQRSFRNNRRIKEDEMRRKGQPLPDAPYRPLCDSVLADRLMESASRVKLFSKLRHLTNQAALTAIFDNGLAGRNTLIKQLQKFTPAALTHFDIGFGDANKICFGPQGIDSSWLNEKTVEIIFSGDLQYQEKLPASCKQQDLGFVTRRDKYPPTPLFLEGTPLSSLSFIHTERLSDKKEIEFLLLDINQRPVAWAKLSPSELMTNNLIDVSQIFVLNFFKFIDNLAIYNPSVGTREFKPAPATSLVQSIYDKIGALSPAELDAFLHRIGLACTRTAEFNIYGVHQIDFSTIESITARYLFQYDQAQAMEVGLSDSYILNIKNFISALNEGSSLKLHEARQNIPELFKSYRFLEFLNANIHDQSIRTQLEILYENCEIPQWRKVITAQRGLGFWGAELAISSPAQKLQKKESTSANCEPVI